MTRINVVISGFDPYEGVEDNPSRIVIERLAEQGVSADEGDDVLHGVDFALTSVLLPVSFERAWPELKRTLDEVHPDIVVATGLKRGARGILLERCATNMVDVVQAGAASFSSDLAEVRDRSADRQPIDASGPAALWTRLPLRSILHDFGEHGIASALSSDAGTFVCNTLFYHLMNWTALRPRVLSGFVSLPVISQHELDTMGLTVEQQVAACRDVVLDTARYYLEPTSADILLA